LQGVTKDALVAVRHLKNQHQSITLRARVVRDQLEQLTGVSLCLHVDVDVERSLDDFRVFPPQKKASSGSVISAAAVINTSLYAHCEH
jgi:hypothetical protein